LDDIVPRRASFASATHLPSSDPYGALARNVVREANMLTRFVLVAPLLALAPSCGAPTDGVTPEPAIAETSDRVSTDAPITDARRTRTPIKHAIVIIGENRTFDHVFATYKPRHHQRVRNLLSEGIIREDGSPGPNYALATQFSAVDAAANGFELSPMEKSLYDVLPPPLAGGPTTPYFPSAAVAAAAEQELPPSYMPLLLTGGTGLASGAVDTRIHNVASLPPGPFQLTPGVKYDDYAASPVHRFYQMWQQLDCNAAYATRSNPSGCKSDLFPWVEVSVGAGANGKPQPSPFTDATTGEGSTAMGFYNVLQGDAPYLKELADHYAMSDNFHQAVQGGTGANHVALGTGDAIWFSDGKGGAAVPPVNEIENPNAQAGTNNWYTQDGYSGGTYSECSDATHPGVGAILGYLAALPRPVPSRCEKGHYYLLNNYAPGYFGDGSVNSDPFAIPPSTLRTVGDALGEKHISYAYYGEHWNRYLADPQYKNPLNVYCDICNFLQYSTATMSSASERAAHLKDATDFDADVASGKLPAVSYLKPSGIVDGHPASSKLDLFEGFVKKVVDEVKANPALWADTAIFVTFDEGGGYYDSGYVQAVDYFGDGTRIPMIVVSPWTEGGRISHDYTDHVSILKFIEANWDLRPLTARSRDNLPNPRVAHDPYVPVNSPAIGDLMDFFER
jgi:phospholipase C